MSCAGALPQARAESRSEGVLTSEGTRPAPCGSAPSMVWVLPLPVWPYARMDELYPARQFSTIGLPTAAQAHGTLSWPRHLLHTSLASASSLSTSMW